MIMNHFLVFGNMPLLIPTAVACVALFDGVEAGGSFGLISGVVWSSLSPGNHGAYIFLMTIIGVIIGNYGRRMFNSSLASCVLLSMLATLCCEGVMFVLNYIVGTAGINAIWLVLLPEALYSMVFCPLIIWLCRSICNRWGDYQ
jgi:rod shape-determining protein MreD